MQFISYKCDSSGKRAPIFIESTAIKSSTNVSASLFSKSSSPETQFLLKQNYDASVSDTQVTAPNTLFSQW